MKQLCQALLEGKAENRLRNCDMKCCTYEKLRSKGAFKRKTLKVPDPWGTPNKTKHDEEQFPKFTEKNPLFEVGSKPL